MSSHSADPRSPGDGPSGERPAAPAAAGGPGAHPGGACLVGVVMGSSSDWETMQHAVQILTQFGVAHEARVAVSYTHLTLPTNREV